MAKPFLKWAGGKAKLAPTIVAGAPVAMARYCEPFLGAGAVFFALSEARPAGRSVLNDANPDLIETFTVLRDEPETLIAELRPMAAAYLDAEPARRRELYYEHRGGSP